MFTFKKIALLGAAGLAAFSMSCTESDGEDVGGSWTTAFNAVYDDGAFDLKGVIKAEPEGNTIKSLSGTVGGKSTNITGVSVTSGVTTTINLDGGFIGLPASVCDGASGQQKNVKVEVKVEFICGEPLIGSKELSVTCPSGGAETVAIKTLQVGGTSASLGSFVDLDANTIYTSANAKLAANAPKIDIVYGVAFGDNANEIWSASNFGWEVDGYEILQNNTAAFIIPLEDVVDATTANQAYVALTTGSSIPLAALAPYLEIFADPDAAYLDKAIDEGLSVTKSNNVFIVRTTERNKFIVAVKSRNGTTDITLAHLLATGP